MSDSNYNCQEQHALLQFVRNVITAKLNQQPMPPLPSIPSSLTDKLAAQGSCFVTLHSDNGMLRGCIGNIMAHEPLGDNIAHNAINAAFKDPRFAPLQPEELDHINIEISILTPMRLIDSLEQFEIGRHGIVMTCNGHSAVFLPQVAPEQGWDKATTLSYLSMKAGLPRNAWQSDAASFQVFEAIVFAES